MTHRWGEFDTDPADRRAKNEIDRLNYALGTLRYQVIANAHLADSLQERIARLEMQRDALFNRFRTCECGLERKDHLPDGKCPFAATHFKERR